MNDLEWPSDEDSADEFAALHAEEMDLIADSYHDEVAPGSAPPAGSGAADASMSGVSTHASQLAEPDVIGGPAPMPGVDEDMIELYCHVFALVLKGLFTMPGEQDVCEVTAPELLRVVEFLGNSLSMGNGIQDPCESIARTFTLVNPSIGNDADVTATDVRLLELSDVTVHINRLTSFARGVRRMHEELLHRGAAPMTSECDDQLQMQMARLDKAAVTIDIHCRSLVDMRMASVLVPVASGASSSDTTYLAHLRNLIDITDIKELKGRHVRDIIYALVLQAANGQGLCKIDERVFAPLNALNSLEKMVFTTAYEFKCTIEEFINGMSTFGSNHDMTMLLSPGSGNSHAVAEFIQKRVEPHFPELLRERTAYAFKDGVYIGRLRQFVGDHSRAHQSFKPHHVAKRFTPINMRPVMQPMWDAADAGETHSFMEICTPALDKTILSQLAPMGCLARAGGADPLDDPEIRKTYIWIIALLGRLLYKVGDMDNWHVMLWLYGEGGTGKSNIISMVMEWFDQADVGVLANNTEEKFGLQMMTKKPYILVAPDTGINFTINHGQLLSMVANEAVSAPVKNAPALEMKPFDTPLLFAGNVLPPFDNTASQWERRIVVFHFATRIAEALRDPSLSKQLREESMASMVKCNEAYHTVVCEVGPAQDVWKVMPKYFLSTRQVLREVLTPFVAFLDSGMVIVELGGTCLPRMQMNRVTTLFHRYCSAANVRKPPSSGGPGVARKCLADKGCTMFTDPLGCEEVIGLRANMEHAIVAQVLGQGQGH